ncbi:protein ANKUB1-like [Anneissia japonica]|uniref:protein ANKUB1-like n=1 Tax=Anneissia japonica TaxID=1529436 RepID=UPI0014254CFE|nr:protein ANKUB1-like [Anneissia japonica]XP_033108474.1 protein ANKUB1-like [Anneissia japonica]
MLRIFVANEGNRCALDVATTDNVGKVKDRVQDVFQIDTRSSGEKKFVVLSYHGSELQDNWEFGDIGIMAGATLRCSLKEEVTPKLYVNTSYNDETVEVTQEIKFHSASVRDLRSIISFETGLPVTTFRLLTVDGVEMFDPIKIDDYGIELGSRVTLNTWDGWNEFLKACMIGHTSQVIHHMSQDEMIVRYQSRVALFIAAHHGHMDLATAMLRNGVRSDEAVGDHPSREWCSSSHVEAYSTPVHEAVVTGQLSILRIFVYHNICCVTCKDGNGLTPLNIALRRQKRDVAVYLLTKQWSNVQFNSMTLPLTIYSHIRKWCDRAKERVMLIHGPGRSSMRFRRTKQGGALCGQGVQVDGFTESGLNSHSKGRSYEQMKNKSLVLVRKYMSHDDPETEVTPVTKLPRIQAVKTPSLVTFYRRKALEKKNTRQSTEDLNRHISRRFNEKNIRGNLPKIVERNSSQNELNKDETSRSSYVHTPGTGRKRTKLEVLPKLEQSSNPSFSKSFAEKEKERKTRKKDANMESLIPLPIMSTDTAPERPFYFCRSHRDNIPRLTVDLYEDVTGTTTWERAIESLTIASTFTEKPWLHQVRLAMSLSKQHVKKLGKGSKVRRKRDRAYRPISTSHTSESTNSQKDIGENKERDYETQLITNNEMTVDVLS